MSNCILNAHHSEEMKKAYSCLYAMSQRHQSIRFFGFSLPVSPGTLSDGEREAHLESFLALLDCKMEYVYYEGFSSIKLFLVCEAYPDSPYSSRKDVIQKLRDYWNNLLPEDDERGFTEVMSLAFNRELIDHDFLLGTCMAWLWKNINRGIEDVTLHCSRLELSDEEESALNDSVSLFKFIGNYYYKYICP